MRKQFTRKAELYETYSHTVKKVVEKKASRRSFPHSTIDHNDEGLLEAQIKQRAQSQSGVRAWSKKRTLKQVPPQTRDDIAKMYLERHVFQKDIAKYYRISQNMVSRIVREYQEDPKKNPALLKLEEKEREQQLIIKSTL